MAFQVMVGDQPAHWKTAVDRRAARLKTAVEGLQVGIDNERILAQVVGRECDVPDFGIIDHIVIRIDRAEGLRLEPDVTGPVRRRKKFLVSHEDVVLRDNGFRTVTASAPAFDKAEAIPLSGDGGIDYRNLIPPSKV